ncbi:hypothetical protein RF644_08320 [Kocuria sp. CPCC 205258]
MSIHALLEQSRRNLAWRTCPTTTITMTPAAPAAVSDPAEQLFRTA